MQRLILLFSIVFLSCLTSCDTQEKERAVTRRNTAITRQHSFSKFFFDSAALGKYLEKNKIADTIANRMISFYNARNYQYAWFSDDGPTEQARGFWNMYKYSLTYDKSSVINDPLLTKAMDRYVARQGTNWAGMQKKLLSTELQLTDHFIRYYLSNFDKGDVKRREMENFIPFQKVNAVETADSLLNKKQDDGKYFTQINKSYRALKDWLEKYLAIYQKGGWPVVKFSARELNKKTSSPTVSFLKKRLILSEDMAPGDTSSAWNAALDAAIKKFQLRHGYTPDGTLTNAQLADMNVPVAKRIAQLLINMGRMQWQVIKPEGKFIVVNIPQFTLHVTEDGKKVFDMEVVVGKEGHSTMLFTGKLNQVVFAPYWNVPESITENEILPEIQQDPNYLFSQNMEVVGQWEEGVPKLRQLPGPKNALGKVKFLFPNSFDIYFHDTPAKSLFEKDKRAFSHGCIRLADAAKMAGYLLKDDPLWPPARIAEAMNAREEKVVTVKNPVAVLITYYTAWVDEAGLLHFASDIYGHDRQQVAKMFTSD